jgi:AraC-like DNA-binding protein
MSNRIQMHIAGRTRPLKLGPRAPLLMSAATSWAGLPFEIHQMQGRDGIGEAGPSNGEYGVMVVLNGQIDIVRREGVREVCAPAVAGTVSLLSGDNRHTIVRMTGSAEVAAINVPPDWFQRLSLTAFAGCFGQRRPVLRDETARLYACAMRDEVARGALTGPLYAESLSATLLSYIAGTAPVSNGSLRGRLSDADCSRLRAYVREHLHEALSLSELSALVGLGPRQFSSVFRRAFGTTPHRYVLRERLNEGARLLADSEIEVAEVAMRLGFCNQSHFTLAFRRAFGITPWRYACARRTD